ncbi:MAG TPA: hypothetical protein VIC08_06665, partial [Cellvibrionaceae bacterium]
MVASTRVLLLNGDDALLQQLGSWLESAMPGNFSMDLCQAAEEGLVPLLSDDYQAAILNFDQHPEQARELLQAVKHQSCPIPVLILSATMIASL